MIKEKKITGFLFLAIALFVLNNARGQPAIPSIAWSSTTLRFATDADLQNGVTLTGGPLQVQFQPSSQGVSAGWSLKVTAITPFSNTKGSSIDPSHFFLTYDHVNGGSHPSDAEIRAATSSSFIRLGTTGAETPLITPCQGPFPAYAYTTIFFNARVEGGNYLYQNLTTGDYQSTLLFSWYDAFGNLIFQNSKSIDFVIDYVGTASNGNFSITLNDPDVTFDFNQPGAYVNGLTIQKPSGLHITNTGWNDYKVQVFTTDNNLVRDQNTSIPMSVVKLGISIHTPGITDITVYSGKLPLSITHTTIIQRTTAAQQELGVDFDLTYSITGSTDLGTISNAPPGTYTSVITYVVSPP